MSQREGFVGSRFVGGDWKNGFALRFAVREDGTVATTFSFDENKEGPPGIVHGGAISAVIDEAMTAATFAIGRPGFTVNLTIDYKASVPIDAPVEIIGQVEKVEGKKIHLSSKLSLSDGAIAVVAKGLFLHSKH